MLAYLEVSYNEEITFYHSSSLCKLMLFQLVTGFHLVLNNIKIEKKSMSVVLLSTELTPDSAYYH